MTHEPHQLLHPVGLANGPSIKPSVAPGVSQARMQRFQSHHRAYNIGRVPWRLLKLRAGTYANQRNYAGVTNRILLNCGLGRWVLIEALQAVVYATVNERTRTHSIQ